MAGIDQELSMREMAVGGNPQAAQQRYAQSKSLMDLLVAQKVSNDYASARNAMQAATQTPTGTVKDQLDMSNAQVTRNDMMRSMMPGVQMKAARDSQAMQRQAMGIPTQPAPNIRMADGGIVGYKDGGIIQRIMDFFRRDMQPITEEQLNEADRMDLTGTFTPRMMEERNAAIDARTRAPMPRPDDRAPKAQVVSGPPTRAEKFAQMFPKAREYVNQGGGSAMGGLQYLQMVGRKQQEAKEEEARRAANYIKMLARSQDMIDEVDPANTLPPEITAFAPGGDVEGEEYVSPGLAASRKLYDPRTEGSIFSGLTEGQQEALARREDFNRIVEARNQAILQDEDPVAAMNAVKRQIAVENLPDIGYQPDTFNVTQMISEIGKDPKDFRMQGVQPEPFRMQGMEASDREKLGSMVGRNAAEMKEGELPEKKGIFDNVDIGRLQAFLAGGGGQTSTAGALGGGLRGLMAEDQRREALASQEAIEAAKIASQRYGAQLDYDAALAKLDQDERESLRTAQTNILKEQLGGDIAAARDALDDIENNSEYQQEFMRLSAEFGDNPAKLRAELAAVAAELVANRQDIYRSTVGGKDAGGFKAELPSGE
jgi:hypothetical protein